MRVRGMEQELTEFAEFYESTREDCLRIVLLNVGDLHLAQDLVAEAYTRAWLSWRKVRAGGAAGMGSAHRAEYACVLVAPPSA
jgi:DNA-directed RNA polymerase specialized sigma24 family protein